MRHVILQQLIYHWYLKGGTVPLPLFCIPGKTSQRLSKAIACNLCEVITIPLVQRINKWVKKKEKKNGERLKCFARVDPYSISTMASYNGQKRSRIFTSSREYFCRVGNIFAESRIFLRSREQFLHVEFWQPVEDFFWSRDFFVESKFFHRVENTQHVMPSFAAKMIKQYAGLQICWLRNFFIDRCRSSNCWRSCGGLGEVSVVYTGLYFSYRTMHSSRKRQKYGIYTRSLGRLCWNNRSVLFGFRQCQKS